MTTDYIEGEIDCIDCEYEPPKLYQKNNEFMEIFQICNHAREPFNGNLDYSVILKIMEFNRLPSVKQLTILQQIQKVEEIRMAEQEKKEKKEKSKPKPKQPKK